MPHLLVTGAFGTLGSAVVDPFLKEGWQVTGTLAPNEKPAVEINNPLFDVHTIDLTDEVATNTFIEHLLIKHPVIDAAVLTVGGFAMGQIEETDLAAVNKMISLNFNTAYNTAQPVFKQMKQQGSGRIFFVGARPALGSQNSKGMFAYGLSKLMVVRLAEMINLEAASMKIRSTVIVPSTIDTPQNRASMPNADTSKWVKPETIADTIFAYCRGGVEEKLLVEF